MDTLEKSLMFNLIKNSLGSYDWSKQDIIKNLNLLEKEVNNKEELKLKKEILKLKYKLEKDDEFFLDAIINTIKEGNLKILKLIENSYLVIKRGGDVVKLKDFKFKIKQVEISILAALITNPKNPYLTEVAKQIEKMAWLQNNNMENQD